jgi:hypothetical protein
MQAKQCKTKESKPPFSNKEKKEKKRFIFKFVFALYRCKHDITNSSLKINIF